MKKNQDIADNIYQAIKQIRKRSSAFDNVFDAFGELIVAKACFKARLPLPETDDRFKPDPVRFSQGESVLNGKMPVFDKSDYLNAAENLLPAMENGFPKIARNIQTVKQAIESNQLSHEIFVPILLGGEDEKLREISNELMLEPQLLRFIIGQIAKPLLEKQADALKPLIQELQWHKGYCPICGSYPELSFLQGNAGERWLRCAVCAHEWRFMRSMCPVCETDKADEMELVFSEEHPYQRAELCHSCKKYLIAFDLRKYPQAIVFDVERIGALYLDVAAQERGYFPIAVTAWNVMD